MGKLTARETLEKTLLIWKEMEKTGQTKTEIYDNLGLSQDLCNCPCCKYAYNYFIDGQDCTICPLYPKSTYGCEKAGEPYDLYKDAGSRKKRQQAGRQMVVLIERRLKELEE